MPQSNNPYVGPRTFEEADSPYFFGRDHEARDLLSLVISEPLVLFYAQSGTGKSSLLNTKLIPGLRDENFNVLPRGRVIGQLPDDISEVENIFVFNLLMSLDQGDQPASKLNEITLTDYLQAHKTKLFLEEYYNDSDYIEREWLDNDDDKFVDMYDQIEGPTRVLIIDQFEEILTTHPERWSDRQVFFEQLAQAIDDDSSLWVVLTMREDYIAGLDPYASMLPGKLRTRFRLEHLQRSAALQAVKKPAARAKVTYADGVTESLVDNLRRIQPGRQNKSAQPSRYKFGPYIEPVYLQIVCHQLWNNLPDEATVILEEHVQAFGDVDQALIDYYERTIKQVAEQTTVSERSLRTWINSQLITPAQTRSLVYQGKDDTAGLPNAAIYILQAAYIIRADLRGANTWYELSHDRLVEPILNSNEAWEEEHRNPLTAAAMTWMTFDKNPDCLYEGERLSKARAYADNHAAELSELEQAFIQASIEAIRQKAAQHSRRIILVGMIVLTVFAILTIYAFYSAQQARSERDRAEFAQAAANQSQAKAEAASTQAVSRQMTAEAEKEKAISVRADAISNLEARLTTEAQLNKTISQKETYKIHLQATIIAQDDVIRVLLATPTPTPKRPSSLPRLTALPLPPPTTTPQPTATVSATPDRQGTATTEALENELASIRATQTAEILSVSMVFVPAGNFDMGFLEGTNNVFNINVIPEADEQPARQVFLADFWIDRTEVTNGHYRQCVEAGVCQAQQDGPPIYNLDPAFDGYPVIYISWFDAKTYCQWQGKQLPTEAEWEKAARNGDGRVWSWGNVLKENLSGPITRGNINGSPDDGPVPVASIYGGVGPYDNYDMTGNVWEWVNDWYRPTYYAERPNPDTNPKGPSETDSDGRKIIRGGSFRTEPAEARVDNRNALGPGIGSFDVGFRCAKSLGRN